MYVILYGGQPRCFVTTEADAQELVADLIWEDLLNGFNHLMRISTMSPLRALSFLADSDYRYVYIEEIV